MKKDPIHHERLAARLADALEEAIRQGQWERVLPGYRILAQEWDLSWRTAREALEILEARGLISAPVPGRSREILPTPKRNPQRKETLLFVSERGGALDPDEQELIDEIRLAWVGLMGRDVHERVDFHRYRNPAPLLKRLVKRHRADVVVLKEAPLAWCRAARRLEESVFFLGSNLPQKECRDISGVAFSMRKTVADVAARLHELGHRRILVPDHGRGSTYQHAILGGLETGLGADIPAGAEDRWCPEFSELTPGAWERYWEEAFRRARPTAVIVEKEVGYLSLQAHCMKKRWTIPRDLSVVCLSSSPNLSWCVPTPDRIRFPNHRAVAHFRRWIKQGCTVTGMKILPVEFIKGETVARV